MHRLWIEFGGKGQDFLARDVAGSECAESAGRKIFEGKHHLGAIGPLGMPIVAAVCGNLNSCARMAPARSCRGPNSELGPRAADGRCLNPFHQFASVPVLTFVS